MPSYHHRQHTRRALGTSKSLSFSSSFHEEKYFSSRQEIFISMIKNIFLHDNNSACLHLPIKETRLTDSLSVMFSIVHSRYILSNGTYISVVTVVLLTHENTKG